MNRLKISNRTCYLHNAGHADVLVLLHGFGQRADQFAERSGMIECSDKHGFTLIAPQAKGRNWRIYGDETAFVGRCVIECCGLGGSWQSRTRGRDNEFLVSMAGFSDGATILHMLARWSWYRVSAACAHGGLMPGPRAHLPKWGTRMLIRHGSADRTGTKSASKRLMTLYECATLQVVPDLGHRWPAELNDEMWAWMKGAK